MDFLKIACICDKWLNEIRRVLLYYLNSVDWEISEDTTIKYLKSLSDSNNNY